MKSIRLRGALTLILLCLMSTLGIAAEPRHSVVIEIIAKSMTADHVEKKIADPIEELMGSLEGVLLISAKYSDNKAEITVKFASHRGAGKDKVLVNRVRQALDQMETMPDSIISLSVSVAGMPNSASLEVDPVGKIRPAQVRSYEGSYLGSIQSSNEYIPVVTRFFKSDDRWGDIETGDYQMRELKSIVVGVLSSCLPKEAWIVNCRWQDKYGQGNVAFEFTDDYEQFDASWQIDRLQGNFKWNGAKLKRD